MGESSRSRMGAESNSSPGKLDNVTKSILKEMCFIMKLNYFEVNAPPSRMKLGRICD